jgi:excisionase family DNA binding protein
MKVEHAAIDAAIRLTPHRFALRVRRTRREEDHGMGAAVTTHQPIGITADPARILVTPEQAAEALGIGRWKLYDLLRSGQLASVRIGSCRRIPTSALTEFVAELQRQQADWVA